jgi:hypothetical protein
MPIRSYTCDAARRRITVIGDGPLTAADLISVVTRQIADDAWSYGLLYEATAMPEAMDALIAHLKKVAPARGPRGPVAVVSLGPDAMNIARYIAGTSAPGPIAVFSNRHNAEDWLEAQMRARSSDGQG